MSIIRAFPIFENQVISAFEEYNPLKEIEVQNFWEMGIQGQGITVAILDSGCNSKHPDIQDRIVGGANFTKEDQGDFLNYEDYNGHGTHVAGIVSSDNTIITTSVAPKANLFIGKVLDKNGRGNTENLINSIYYAINWRGQNKEKIRVICMSLGTTEKNDKLLEAIKAANKAGIPVVAASGNDGVGDIKTTKLRYPGAYGEVVQVGAVDKKLNIANFSNVNNQIDILAPGVSITSTYLKNEYKVMTGTSMAAPFVAGSMALLIEKIEKEIERQLSESEVYAQLIKHTKKLNYSFKEEGNGLLYLKR